YITVGHGRVPCAKKRFWLRKRTDSKGSVCPPHAQAAGIKAALSLGYAPPNGEAAMLARHAKFTLLAFLFCLSAPATNAADAVTDAVGNPARPQWDLYRDSELKPAQLLAFAGAKPGMVAADILPEGGYWTRILSLVAGQLGDVYMMVPSNGAGSDRG